MYVCIPTPRPLPIRVRGAGGSPGMGGSPGWVVRVGRPGSPGWVVRVGRPGWVGRPGASSAGWAAGGLRRYCDLKVNKNHMVLCVLGMLDPFMLLKVSKCAHSRPKQSKTIAFLIFSNSKTPRDPPGRTDKNKPQTTNNNLKPARPQVNAREQLLRSGG